MRKTLIFTLLVALSAHAAENSALPQLIASGLNKIKASKTRKTAISELTNLRKLVNDSPEIPDQILLKGEYIGMMDQILKDQNSVDTCKNQVLEFKISNFDYNDKKTYPQKQVVQMVQVLEKICNLKP